jgi:hypothetical protein
MGMTAHNCNPSYLEGRDYEDFNSSLGKGMETSSQPIKLGVVVYGC